MQTSLSQSIFYQLKRQIFVHNTKLPFHILPIGSIGCGCPNAGVLFIISLASLVDILNEFPSIVVLTLKHTI